MSSKEVLPKGHERITFIFHHSYIMMALVALVLEATLFQLSFWSTAFMKETDFTGQMQAFSKKEAAGQGFPEEMSEGAMLLSWKDLDCEVRTIHLDCMIPENMRIKVTVWAQDEGNFYPYQLGKGRILLSGVPQNSWMKVYPYGNVRQLYLLLEEVDGQENAVAHGRAASDCRINAVTVNGRMPFSFQPLRALLVFGALALMHLLREDGSFVKLAFTAEQGDVEGQKKRRIIMLVFAGCLLGMSMLFVRINPACRENLAPHHAQYQELAKALLAGEVSVGEADEALLLVENPYDTIQLQAEQIPYRADYAYYDGKYYVYFGIVPELLLYLPCYLLTGHDLPNYLAVFLFYAGFICAAAGLIYELMKRFFAKAPLYLYFVGVFMLTGSYSGFYLLIRPDLYDVPIAASYMFAAAGLWCYLAGLNREKKKALWYAAGSLCLALTAGCRPQFVLFFLLAVPLFWEEVFRKRSLFSKKGAVQTAALIVPCIVVALGLMYYNVLRFGSPADFGASYSMTSNDMTHRGFNMERILYGLWYFLLEPARLEADFPYLRSASIETDYLGRMVSESCFGGIFACSMLTWPVFILIRLWKLRRKENREGTAVLTTALLSAGIALAICAVDATGAGILIRYSCDVSYGLFLAAFIGLCALEKRADRKKAEGAFLGWLRIALLLHLAFLFLVLVQKDGSVNLMNGNPVLYHRLAAMFRI